MLQELDALEAAAESIDPALPEASAAALRRAVVFLRDDLRPHAVGEEQSLYPAAEPLIKQHGGAVALLEMAHLYLDDAMARFSLDVGRLLDGGLSREERETIVARVRRTAYALKAVLAVRKMRWCSPCWSNTSARRSRRRSCASCTSSASPRTWERNVGPGPAGQCSGGP
jgi:hypothetical protein